MTPMEQQRKAIVAGLIAGVSAATVAALNEPFTLADWLAVAGALLAGYQGVFWTTNDRPAEPLPDQLT